MRCGRSIIVYHSGVKLCKYHESLATRLMLDTCTRREFAFECLLPLLLIYKVAPTRGDTCSKYRPLHITCLSIANPPPPPPPAPISGAHYAYAAVCGERLKVSPSAHKVCKRIVCERARSRATLRCSAEPRPWVTTGWGFVCTCTSTSSSTAHNAALNKSSTVYPFTRTPQTRAPFVLFLLNK